MPQKVGKLNLLTAATVILLSASSFTFAAMYVPVDQIFLNCGAGADGRDNDNKMWLSDERSKFLSSSKSKAAQASQQDPSVSQIPYMTARLFDTTFTYTFPLSSGRIFLRLYFYPSEYDSRNSSTFFFSVSAGSHTLLTNFSVGLTASALNYAFIVKEYSIFVPSNSLNLTFTPKEPSSAAFINGIEIVSMPDIYSNTNGLLRIVGQNAPFTVNNSTALEEMYRINVAGRRISPSDDTGMFRSWNSDENYLRGAAVGATEYSSSPASIKYRSMIDSYMAPSAVYQSARSMGPTPAINLNYNLTWIFSVHAGFMYLVRLHFCEVWTTVRIANERVFDIFLFNETAESGFDVIQAAGHSFVPTHRDYVVLVPGRSSHTDFWVSLHPNVKSRPQYYDAVLNGLEIFKINDSNGNLAAHNPISVHHFGLGHWNCPKPVLSGVFVLLFWLFT